MNPEAALVAAIEAEPKREASRLIYADWLDEAGRAAEAEFLRAEWTLFQTPPGDASRESTRLRFWEAWGRVDARWLATFTQPRTLLVNPTPFAAAWWHFDLGELRPARGTYDGWTYESLPPLSLAGPPGDFSHLPRRAPSSTPEAVGRAERERAAFARASEEAAARGFTLPESFTLFMHDRELRAAHHSVTDSFFTEPDDYSPVCESRAGDALHFLFYSDSQSCVLWDLYLHRNGGHCVIARDPDYFDPENVYDEAEDFDETFDERPPGPNERAWFVAPSFEAFVRRVHLENLAWCCVHEDFLRSQGEAPPEMTPELRAYLDHYRNPARERRDA